MSLSRETKIALMALADGELDGAERERLERLTAESEEARRLVQSIRAPDLQSWLDEALDPQRSAADGIADAVMSRLEGARLEGARLEGARPGAQRPTRKDRATPRRLSRAATAGVLACGGLALAAAVAMYVRATDRGDANGREARVVPAAPVTGAPGGQTETAQAERPPAGRGVEVEEIDSPAHVSIFEIAAVANASTAPSVVVWIDDEPGPN